jgi:hypothetical protein
VEAQTLLNMPVRTFTFEMCAGNFITIPWQESLCAPSRFPPLLRVEL